jgi:hypothetical protein
MAKVTTMDTATETPKNGRIRASNPPPEDPVAPTDRRLPKIGNPNAGSNWEYIDSIADEQWKQLTCYVYRTAPVVDRQAAGKEISIDKLGQRFDMKEIINRHGSGRYKFILSYAPPSGGQWIRVRQFYETILDLNKPPRVALGEWIENPANKDWEWAEPLLRAEAVEREQTAAEKIAGKSQPQQNAVEQLSDTIDLAQKLVPKDNTSALLLELLKMNDPSKHIALAKEFAALNNPAPREDGSMALLMKFLVDELKEMRAARASTPDPLETATKLLTGAKDLFGTLGMGAPAAAAAKSDTTSVIVSTVGDILGRTVDKLGEYAPNIMALVSHLKDRDLQIAEIRARQGMNPDRPWEFQGSRTAPATRTINTQPQPTGPIITPPPAAQTAPVNAPPPAAPVMTPQLLFQKYNALLNAHFMTLIDKFKNETGFSMQDHLLDREGRNTFNQFREDATVDLLMGLVASNGQLKTIFTPPEKARQFFEELLSEPPPAGEAEDDDDDDEEDGDGPIGADNA